MPDEARCCTGTPMAENIAKDGYCCAKPTDEELVEAQEEAAAVREEEEAKALEEPWPCRAVCERAGIPTNVSLAEREAQFAGGSRRAQRADMIFRLYPDGTYRILKNRGAASSPFAFQAYVIYVDHEGAVPFPVKGKV